MTTTQPEAVKYDHNQICTSKKEVITGKEYDYTEEGLPCRVRVLSQNQDADGIGFELEVVLDPAKAYEGAGHRFSPWASTGHYAYSGMWRLWDAGEYVR